MNDKVNSDPYLLIEQIERISKEEFYTPEEFDSWIDALANLGKPAVETLLKRMPGLVSSRLHYVSAHVFARVGYPINSKALEFMVSDMSNTNSSSYPISLDAILKVGAPALPVIEDALEFYRKDSEEYQMEIDSLEEIKERIRK